MDINLYTLKDNSIEYNNFNDGKKNVSLMDINGNYIHTTSTDTFISDKWSFNNENNIISAQIKGYSALLDIITDIQITWTKTNNKYSAENLISNKKYGEGEMIKIC